MNPQRLFVGIDGGGTHSYAVTVNDAGRVLATAQSGSLNFHGGGLERARRSLNELVTSLQLPEVSQVDNFVIGCAALFTNPIDAEKEQFCSGIVPLARTKLVGDCVTAYHGASLGQAGVLVIAGTGSIILVRNEAGEFSQLGGWGHLLGDAGSAWWIALESVKAAIAATEGLGPATELPALICRFFEVKELKEIIPIVYDAAYTKDQFAALANFLAEHARQDEGFQQVCRRGGRELAAQALAAVKRADLRLSPVPLYLSGGVLENNPLMRDSLVGAMSAERPVKLVAPQMLAPLGAAALALAEGGVTMTPKLLETLQSSYRDFAARKAAN